MSFKGQYLRGEKWYLMNRDSEGKLSKNILEDKDKMVDINVYLEAQKKAEKTKPTGKK